MTFFSLIRCELFGYVEMADSELLTMASKVLGGFIKHVAFNAKLSPL